jgi:hypothetical protein
MPIGLHLTLSIICQMGGALGCAYLAMTHTKEIDALGINSTVAFFGAFILGHLIPKILFKYVISARCPKCGEPARYHGGRPITYHCRCCGNVHRTKVSEGSSHHNH